MGDGMRVKWGKQFGKTFLIMLELFGESLSKAQQETIYDYVLVKFNNLLYHNLNSKIVWNKWTSNVGLVNHA
jgi:hypothetical protein